MVVLIRPIVHLRLSVERRAQRPMDRPSFLFFRSSFLARESHRSPGWAAPEVGSQVLTKTSCRGRFHCAEWSCIVLRDSPRRRNGSGRDWPHSAVKLVDDLAGASPGGAD